MYLQKSMVVSLVVLQIDWIECLLLAAALALPQRHWRPRRNLLPRICRLLRPAALLFFRRVPLSYLSRRPATALAVLSLLLPLLPASIMLLLLALFLPVPLPLLAASVPLYLLAAFLWLAASLRLFFSSSSPLVAKAADSFRKGKEEEASKAFLCCLPLAGEKEEESVPLAAKVAASFRKRKEVWRAFLLRPPCVCRYATEPLLLLLLHLLADQAGPLSFCLQVYSDAVNVLCCFLLAPGSVKLEHSVNVHNNRLFVAL
jgi:hypothetical protein